ncbi:hypothetical protein BAE44_0017132 [Dichanthelium oligosanthes]|uniref:Uncharacterized protein n=1 Tax=Dichanthelium oligosanthes TaxID=888268 RepID=A0A1E5V9M6_9POAL|nr:hypothetical protein BAE44_0017132 [Dichanthelium oligosanthes]
MASNNGADAPPDTPADVRRCICSPTTHPGSFRCRLHRGVAMPRSASCQQLGAPRPRSLCSDLHMRRAASQLQLARPAPATVGVAMSRSSSEQQLLRPLGIPRSASSQDFLPKE